MTYEIGIEELLSRVATSWRNIATDLEWTTGRLAKVVGEDETQTKKLKQNLDRFLSEVSSLEDSAKHPEVLIAITGTTSSGKSTLANLLIGEQLLPEALREMTAGITTVTHHDEIKMLKVEDTDDARWETGVWEDVTAEEVYDRLEAVMYAYHELVNEYREICRKEKKRPKCPGHPDVAPPRFHVIWPTRMGREASRFGLPRKARLSLIDLPGLKYLDDELNSGLILEQTRRALSIVAYDSFATDPQKEEKLVKEVADQIKALNGSPARMLFVLNKIDAFLKDRDPGTSEQKFTERVTKRIQWAVAEALPEYSTQVEAIKPIPLSSGPALSCVLADQAEPDQVVGLIRILRNHYGALYPDEMMDKLASNPKDWSEDEQEKFFERTRTQARLPKFEAHLSTHIASNLPELLVPVLVDAVYNPGRELVANLESIVIAYGEGREAELEAMKAELEKLYERLIRIKDETFLLLEALQSITINFDYETKLYDVISQLEKNLKLEGPEPGTGALAPLGTGVFDFVGVPMQRLNDYVMRRMDGEKVEEDFIQRTGLNEVLDDAVENLRYSPYGEYWDEGGSFEDERADEVENSLAELSLVMSEVASKIMEQEARGFTERMHTALVACADAVVNRIERQTQVELEKAGFQGLRGVFRGTYKFKPLKIPTLRFEFESKKMTIIEIRQVQKSYWVKERKWYFLFLVKKNVKKYRTVEKKTKTQKMNVGKLGDIIENFSEKVRTDELGEAAFTWFEDTLNSFDVELGQRLEKGVDIYRKALQKRIADLKNKVKFDVQKVQPFREDAQHLLQNIENCREWKTQLKI